MTRSRVRSSFGLTLIGFGMLAATAACGSDGSKSVAIADPMARAEAAVAEQDSVSVEMSVDADLTTEFLGQEVATHTTTSGEGEIRLRPTQQGHLDMTTTVDVGGSPQRQKAEMVLDGTDAYMKIGGLSLAELGAPNAKWLKMDLSELGASGGQTYLDTLKGLTDVDKVGTERIRDTDTIRYKGNVNWEAAAAKATTDTARKLIEATSKAMPNAAVDVWIDGDNRPRRMVMVMDMSQLGENLDEMLDAMGMGELGVPADEITMSGIQTIQVDYVEYGVEVDVEIPPANEVLDKSLSELMSDAAAAETAEGAS